MSASTQHRGLQKRGKMPVNLFQRGALNKEPGRDTPMQQKRSRVNSMESEFKA